VWAVEVKRALSVWQHSANVPSFGLFLAQLLPAACPRCSINVNLIWAAPRLWRA